MLQILQRPAWFGQAFYILHYNSVIGIQVFSPMVWNFSITPKKESAKANYALLWYFQTTLGTYGHIYPNTNVEVAKKLTGVLTYTPATTSVVDYTSNQHTAIYHRAVE